MKKVVVLLAAGVLAFGFSTTSLAFHAGGVGSCDGCHTMHNSEDGAIMALGGTVGTGVSSYLTVGVDPSSTCLSCHISIYKAMSTDGSLYSPGGDFYWMTQDFTALYPRDNSEGFRHGHNVVAATYGIGLDTTLTTGPSDGTVNFPSSALGCNSCHDPHGKIANNANPAPITASGSYGDAVPTDGSILGNFRLLGGLGYDGGDNAPSGISFASAAPVATSYHGSAAQWPAETDINHTDYGSGMSEWCANCHSGFTAAGATEHRHPADNDAHLNGFGSNYDQYRATGDVGGANTNTDSYDRLVPFERGITDSTLLSTASTTGPDTNSNVMCLTCHRAHASPFNNAGRWDFILEIITEPVGVLASADAVDAYYGDDVATRYSAHQRSLCNKCHVQD